jgi:hypothetical protein
MNRFTFDFVENQVRRKTFGVLTTIDSKGRPHSTGVIYAIGPPNKPFALYIIAGENYVKVRNIKRNPNVSLVVTFPHYWVRFAPASYVMFRGKGEVLPRDDADGIRATSRTRVGRIDIQTQAEETRQDFVYIRVKPEPIVFCFGLGYSLMELRGNHAGAGYKVTIPEDRC